MKKIVEWWKTRKVRRLKRQLVQMSLGERNSRLSPPSKRKSKPIREAGSLEPGGEVGSSKPNGEAASSEPGREGQSVTPGGGVGKPKPSRGPGNPKPDSGKGGQAPDSGVGSSTPGNKAGNPKPVSETGSPKPDSEAGSHKSNDEAGSANSGSEARSPKPGSEAAGSTPGNEAEKPKPVSQPGSVKPGSEAGSPKPGSGARSPKPDSEAGDSKSGNEVRNLKPVSETGSPKLGSEAGNDERSLKHPAEDAQFDDRYLPLRNLLHFLALEVDKLRDLFIINRLNTLLKRNISTPDGLLYGAILNDASPGRVLPTQRRKYTRFETFPWTDPLDSNIVRGVMGKPNERQAVIRDMVISVLRMSNPGVRIDFGAVEYSTGNPSDTSDVSSSGRSTGSIIPNGSKVPVRPQVGGQFPKPALMSRDVSPHTVLDKNGGIITREPGLFSPEVPSAKGEGATGRGTTREQGLVSPTIAHAQGCAANAVEKSILRFQDFDGFDHISTPPR